MVKKNHWSIVAIIGTVLLLPTISANAATISIDNVSVSEGNTGTVQARFTVEVSRFFWEIFTVKVDFATRDDTATVDTDYVSSRGTLRFPFGESDKERVTIQVIGDIVHEGTERFFVDLFNPDNASIADGHGVGIIIDDDPDQAATFDVNRTEDGPDFNPGDGICSSVPPPFPPRRHCTLRAAIQTANAMPGRNAVMLPAGTYTLTRNGRSEDAASDGDLDITEDLTIIGDDAVTTVIDAGGIDRVFHVLPGVKVTISSVTISGGFATGLDGSGTNLGSVGGGIMHEGVRLELLNCIISDNRANAGGGVYTTHHPTTPPRFLVIDGCTLRGNRAEDLGYTNAFGGGIDNSGGTVLVTNSVLFGNLAEGGAVAGGGGAAIRGESGGERIQIENSTISGNEGSPAIGSLNTDIMLKNVTVAENSSFGIDFGSCCGHLITFSNTIVANNAAGDCSFFPTGFVSNGHNLSSDVSCGFTGPGDLENTNPFLAPLQDNGGPTQTHALMSGSPAIDAGDNTSCPGTDQRGVIRPQGLACDIGAFEFISEPFPWEIFIPAFIKKK